MMKYLIIAAVIFFFFYIRHKLKSKTETELIETPQTYEGNTYDVQEKLWLREYSEVIDPSSQYYPAPGKRQSIRGIVSYSAVSDEPLSLRQLLDGLIKKAADDDRIGIDVNMDSIFVLFHGKNKEQHRIAVYNGTEFEEFFDHVRLNVVALKARYGLNGIPHDLHLDGIPWPVKKEQVA